MAKLTKRHYEGFSCKKCKIIYLKTNYEYRVSDQASLMQDGNIPYLVEKGISSVNYGIENNQPPENSEILLHLLEMSSNDDTREQYQGAQYLTRLKQLLPSVFDEFEQSDLER